MALQDSYTFTNRPKSIKAVSLIDLDNMAVSPLSRGRAAANGASTNLIRVYSEEYWQKKEIP